MSVGATQHEKPSLGCSRSKIRNPKGRIVTHTPQSLATEFNNEVVVPKYWHPPRFIRMDWQWMKNIAQSSDKNDKPIRDVAIGGGTQGKKLNCQHRTQPGRNCTIFYRRILPNMIMVLGIGRHVGKSKTSYDVEWADGGRSRIELKTKRREAEDYLSNPIGGHFSFPTLDPIINASHYYVNQD